MSKWPEVAQQLNLMVNQWYDTAEIKSILTVPLTPAQTRLSPPAHDFLRQQPARLLGRRFLQSAARCQARHLGA